MRTRAALFFLTAWAALQPAAAGAFGIGAGGSLGYQTIDLVGTYSDVPVDSRQDIFPYGVKVFLDAKYVQFSVGWLMVSGGSVTVSVPWAYGKATFDQTLSYVTGAVLFKVPFNFSTNEVFPLLGLEYRFNIAALDGAGNDATRVLSAQEKADLNELWLVAGGGADFFFGNFSIRPEITVGLKFLSVTDQGSIAALQDAGYSSASMSYFTINVDLFFGWVSRTGRLSNER
jgi:hypothetical protein